jgi:CRISPR-associated protein Csh2
MSIFDSDILYLYDAKLANPNGDPDEENKPRMDDATGRNLVSDVRLKRYMRDYWLNNKTSDIWVRRNEDGSTTDAKGRMKDLLEQYAKSSDGKKITEKAASRDTDFKTWLLGKLLDVRLFGATMPMSGSSLTFTGPVQFSWGYSLHRVEINPSATISSTFAGRDSGDKGDYGTFGKDWRVLYSLVSFYGIVTRHRARHTELKAEDIETLDNAMLKALPSEATSRSKIGQVPRLYLRIEYKEDVNAKLGDMREDVIPVAKDGKLQDTIRDIKDYELDVSSLVSRIEQHESDIQNAYLFLHPSLATNLKDSLQSILGDRLKQL